MAWRRPGDKPLSEPMMVNYWRIYASPGLNELSNDKEGNQDSQSYICRAVVTKAVVWSTRPEEKMCPKCYILESKCIRKFNFLHAYDCMIHLWYFLVNACWRQVYSLPVNNCVITLLEWLLCWKYAETYALNTNPNRLYLVCHLKCNDHIVASDNPMKISKYIFNPLRPSGAYMRQ